MGSARRRSRGSSGQLGERVEGLRRQGGEGRGGGQVQQPASAGAGVAGRDGQQSQAQPFGLSAVGLVAGQGEGSHSGGQVGAVASVGSTGDLYWQRPGQAFNSLFKAELVRNRGPYTARHGLG
jgi:hypothetical protein